MRNFLVLSFALVALLFSPALTGGADQGGINPKVISTSPKSGDTGVDPLLSKG